MQIIKIAKTQNKSFEFSLPLFFYFCEAKNCTKNKILTTDNYGNQICKILRTKLGFIKAFSIMDLGEVLLFVTIKQSIGILINKIDISLLVWYLE